MKVKTKLQDQFKPNAAVNEDSPVGVEDIKHIFKVPRGSNPEGEKLLTPIF